MTGCMQDFDRRAAEVERFAVDGQMDREIRLCPRSVYDRGAGSLCQVEVARHKIGVEMGFEDIFDGRASFAGKPQISFDIPQGIYDSCISLAINIISGFTETAGI